MSEQPVSAPPKPGSKTPGKKYAGLSRNQWFIVGGVFAGVLGYLLWKRHQAAAAGASSSTGATNQGSDECTDSNGNPVDCGELEAQELAALQNQLDQVQGQSGGGGSSGGGGYDASTPSTDATGTTTTMATPAGTPTSSTGTTSTGTSTTTAKAAPKTAGAITGLKATPGKSSFTASWNKAPNATSYSYAVRNLASHTDQTSGTTGSTSVTISGLKSGTDYNFGIQGLPGGPGANIHVRAG